MQSEDPRQVVNSYLEALGRRDNEAARAYLSDQGFSYVSPIAQFDDADDFTASMEGVGAILHSIKTLHCFVDGNDVCHILDFKVSMSGYQTRRVAQLAHVEAGRITHIEAIFDASEYRRMIEG
jgi:ketosteroid isomerase-like protein